MNYGTIMGNGIVQLKENSNKSYKATCFQILQLRREYAIIIDAFIYSNNTVKIRATHTHTHTHTHTNTHTRTILKVKPTKTIHRVGERVRVRVQKLNLNRYLKRQDSSQGRKCQKFLGRKCFGGKMGYPVLSFWEAEGVSSVYLVGINYDNLDYPK